MKQTSKHRRIRLFLLVVFLGLAGTALALTSDVGQTDWVPQIVDAVRNLPFVGPERMAAVEDAYYRGRDQWDQWYYRYSHQAAAPSEAKPAALIPTPTPIATPYPDEYPHRGTAETPPSALLREAAPPEPGSPLPLAPIITVDPQLGEGVWTASDMPLGSSARPPLWHTFFRPDPVRPYARVDLVHIDLTQTVLSLVPGTVEPRPIDGIPGPGQIPPSVQKSGKLLAAWNGGFLTVHGAFGMMVNRRVILPPKDGLATLAQYADGHIKLGVWGRDITMTPDLVSFRQNGPPLIDQGTVKANDFSTWGKSVSGDIYIWRSGIGMTADGSLVVAVGNPLSAQTLGETLKRAGAVQAMELDVNAWHVFFYTYEQRPNGVVATKLNRDIPGGLQTFLKPYDRDFMYLTAK